MKFFLLFLLGILLSGMPAVAKKHILYVGTYTQGMTNGSFVYKFNDQSGKLVDLEIPVVINNPSFLTISPNKKFLYAVGELDNLDSNQSGGLSAFGIEKKGNLTLINHVPVSYT